MPVSGFQSYSIYNALILHYKSDTYNAYKYKFKTRASMKSFEKRNDRYFFEKLGRRYDVDSLIKFYTANIIKDNTWIGSMTEDCYDELQARLDSLTYRFKSDIKLLADADESFDNICRCKNGSNIVVDHFCTEKISIETIAILDKLVDFINPLLPQLSDPLEFKQDQAMMASKYKHSLVNVDYKKMKQIILKEFTF